MTRPRRRGIGVYYPLPVDVSLRNDFSRGRPRTPTPTNNLLLVYNADYEISQGQIVLQNMSAMANKTIQVLGQGAGKSVITANGTSRDFEILGLNAQKFNNLTVFFQDLSIERRARDRHRRACASHRLRRRRRRADGWRPGHDVPGLVQVATRPQGATGTTGFVGASVTGGPGGPGWPAASARAARSIWPPAP